MKKNDALQSLTALANESRLDVFRTLMASEIPGSLEGGLTPGQLVEALHLPAPTLSFHLKELSRAGLVIGHKTGRSIRYRASFEALQSLAGFLLEDCCKGVSPAQSRKDIA